MIKRLCAALSLFVPVLLSLLTAASGVLAQTSRGTVSGSVTDAQGASISGATADAGHA
jgi:hypothetical protein